VPLYNRARSENAQWLQNIFLAKTRQMKNHHADLRLPRDSRVHCTKRRNGSSAERPAYFASRGVFMKMLQGELLTVPVASVVDTAPAAD